MSRTRSPHLGFSHLLWETYVLTGDIVIDATCGNGQDTKILAQLALNETEGHLFAFDIQSKAISKTACLLKDNVPHLLSRITLERRCHSEFPENIQPESVSLIVYNLGYLPGGDKNLITKEETTLKSLNKALGLLKKQGMISLTCYPGHSGGDTESNSLIMWSKTLNPSLYFVSQHSWINRQNAPFLIMIQKIL